MSTMDYLDFHCSFRGYSKDLYKILFMSTFIAVLAVFVKNHIDFHICQLWIIWTSIAVLGGGVVNNYIDFSLCGFSLQFNHL